MLLQTQIEKIEILLIGVVILNLFLFHSALPAHYSVGWWIVSLAIVLLVQALIRDLYLLYQTKKNPSDEPAISMRCMCLETMLGLPLISIGITVAAVIPLVTFKMPTLLSSVCFSTVLLMGFYIKDIVITWKPFGFRKVKDHSRIHFRF